MTDLIKLLLSNGFYLSFFNKLTFTKPRKKIIVDGVSGPSIDFFVEYKYVFGVVYINFSFTFCIDKDKNRGKITFIHRNLCSFWIKF